MATGAVPYRGQRVIFVTLEDGSCLVDLAFFEDSHEASPPITTGHGANAMCYPRSVEEDSQ